MGIDGVEPEPVKTEQPAKPTDPAPATTSAAVTDDDDANANNEEAAPENVHKPTSAAPDTKPLATGEPEKQAAAQGNPMDGESGNGECNLLGDFALLVQAALGLLAVSSLAVKRMREHPRRPLKIWFFDVSKQVFGSVLLHLANILMSMLSSGKFDVANVSPATTTHLVSKDSEGDQPNPCSFYLLNLAIDVSPLPSFPFPHKLTNTYRLQSASPFLSSSSASSIKPSPSPRSPTPPNPSAQAITGIPREQPGGSNNPSSTSSASSA